MSFMMPADNPFEKKLHPIVITSSNKTILRTKRIIGFTVKEIVGIGVVNSRGLANVSKVKNVIIGN